MQLIILLSAIPGVLLLRPCLGPPPKECVPFTKCKEWCLKAEMIGSDLSVRRKLLENTCNFAGDIPYVCCPASSITKSQYCQISENPSVTDDGLCGKVESNHLRCVGCNSTSPGAWPWMVRLLYANEDKGKETYCGGVLVSNRHVITASHCVEREQRLEKVVLGESNITTEFDCYDIELGCESNDERCFRAGECAPRSVEVVVKGVVKHPEYDRQSKVSYYDIALIVLDDLVEFSDLIRPVCLPELQSSDLRQTLVMTGWGNTVAGLLKPVPATALQEIVLQQVPLKTCSSIWNTKLLNTQMCASSGIPGKAPCSGDSGGPLVRLRRSEEVWELAAVVSAGPSICGNADHPVIFTKITESIFQWLQNKMTK